MEVEAAKESTPAPGVAVPAAAETAPAVEMDPKPGEAEAAVAEARRSRPPPPPPPPPHCLRYRFWLRHAVRPHSCQHAASLAASQPTDHVSRRRAPLKARRLARVLVL